MRISSWQTRPRLLKSSTTTRSSTCSRQLPVVCAAYDPQGYSRRESLLLGTAALSGAFSELPAFAKLPAKSPSSVSSSVDVDLVSRSFLADDLSISQVIRGCWQLDGEHRGDPRTDRTNGAYAIEDFERFVTAGITTFDTADVYGPAEGLLGRYLRLYPERRSHVQVLTKLCFITPGDMEAVSKQSVEYAVRAALLRLGLNRLDSVQLFWGSWEEKGYVDAALWLMELRELGLLRHVGVTNFDTAHLARLVDAGVRVTSNQVQWSVLDRRPELLMAGYCRRNGIALLPHGTVAGGFLSDAYLGVEADGARLDTLSKLKYGNLIQEVGGWAWFQRMLAVLGQVAERHNTSTSSVATRWALQRPGVPAVIVGARNPAHIKEHQLLGSFRLDAQDLLEIDAVYESARKPTSDCYVWERGQEW